MSCKSCGAELFSEYAKHCPNCGMPVEGIPEVDRAAQAADLKSSQAVSFVVVAIGLLLTLVGSFVPFFHFTMGQEVTKITFVDEEWIKDIIVICTICLVGGFVIFLEKRSSGIRQIVVGGVIIATAIIELMAFRSKYADAAKMVSTFIESGMQAGLGFYLMLAGGIFLILAGIVMLVARKDAGTLRKR